MRTQNTPVILKPLFTNKKGIFCSGRNVTNSGVFTMDFVPTPLRTSFYRLCKSWVPCESLLGIQDKDKTRKNSFFGYDNSFVIYQQYQNLI